MTATQLLFSEIQVWEDQTAVGAMFQSPMLMDTEVPDVLISVMTHSIAVINMILENALQDGLVMLFKENASLQTQVTDSAASLSVKTTASHTQDQTNIDAIPQAIFVKNAKMVILDATQTEQLNVITVLIQIETRCSNATNQILTLQNAMLVRQMQLIAIQKKKNVLAATLQTNCIFATRPLLNANNLTIKEEISKLLVMQAAIISLHPI